MGKESAMLFLLMSLLFWNQSEGSCSGTLVRISGDDRVLPPGESFNLSCEFTCLRTQHIAQLWRESRDEERIALANITSTLPTLIVVLSISSATKVDTGYYYCMTHPPETISPAVLIQIADNLTTPNTPQCDSSQHHGSAAGLLSQIWYWILLGKTTILLLILAALAVKCKSG